MRASARRKAKRTWALVLIGIGLLLLAAALVFLVRNVSAAQRADLAAQAALSELDTMLAEVPEPTAPAGEAEEQPEVQERAMRIFSLKETDYIGILSIPELELSLPVINDLSYPNLETAPCRYMGNLYEDSLIIGAHNYPHHFGRLSSLAPGDEVQFTDFYRETHHFTVDRIEQLADTAIEDMEAGDWDLTLFTCTRGGFARIAVRCSRVEAEA